MVDDVEVHRFVESAAVGFGGAGEVLEVGEVGAGHSHGDGAQGKQWRENRGGLVEALLGAIGGPELAELLIEEVIAVLFAGL